MNTQYPGCLFDWTYPRVKNMQLRQKLGSHVVLIGNWLGIMEMFSPIELKYENVADYLVFNRGILNVIEKYENRMSSRIGRVIKKLKRCICETSELLQWMRCDSWYFLSDEKIPHEHCGGAGDETRSGWQWNRSTARAMVAPVTSWVPCTCNAFVWIFFFFEVYLYYIGNDDQLPKMVTQTLKYYRKSKKNIVAMERDGEFAIFWLHGIGSL